MDCLRKRYKLENLVRKKYPYLLIEPAGDCTMLDCIPSGWSDIALKTFKKINKVLKKYAIPVSEFTIDEIKEKYESLVVYWSFKFEWDENPVNEYNYVSDIALKEIDDILYDTEFKSTRVCQGCGKRMKNNQRIFCTRCRDKYGIK